MAFIKLAMQMTICVRMEIDIILASYVLISDTNKTFQSGLVLIKIHEKV